MRSGASVIQLLAVNLLPRAARISTSRCFVNGVAVGLLSVTKKDSSAINSNQPWRWASQPVRVKAPQANQWTLRGVSVDSYAYVFTCTYKHMNQAANLLEGPSRKALGRAESP